MTIGERISVERGRAGLTQAQLASAVGLDRSALAKIETDARRVTALELVAIARELGQRMDWFVAPEPEAVIAHRQRNELGSLAIDRALERVARDVGVVQAMGPGLARDVPRRTPPASVQQAEEMAVETRRLLGVSSDAPVYNLSDAVAPLGLLAFSLPLGDGADAGYVALEHSGVAVINGGLRTGRRRLALAHELGHHLTSDDYVTDWRIALDQEASRESRLDRFGRALLLPKADLTGRWPSWTERTDEDLRDAAVRAGSHYRVDMATLADRLRELGLASPTEVAFVRSVSTRKADIVEKNLHVASELDPISLPRAYERAVLGLYRGERISESRALDLLQGAYMSEELPVLRPTHEHELWSFTT